MSSKKTLFKLLQHHLSQLPSVKWVDKLFGQVDNLSNHVIPYPAILIEFGRWEPISMGNNVQKGPLIIRFHLLYENFAQSFEGSHDQELAMAYFDFVEEVHQALQGLSGTNFTALQRTGEEEDNDHDVIINTIVEYFTELTDNSSGRSQNKTLTEEITPGTKIKKPLSRPSSNVMSEYRV